MNLISSIAQIFAAFATPACLIVVTALQVINYRALRYTRVKTQETHDAVLMVEKATNSLVERERHAAEIVAHALGVSGIPLPIANNKE